MIIHKFVTQYAGSAHSFLSNFTANLVQSIRLFDLELETVNLTCKICKIQFRLTLILLVATFSGNPLNTLTGVTVRLSLFDRTGTVSLRHNASSASARVPVQRPEAWGRAATGIVIGLCLAPLGRGTPRLSLTSGIPRLSRTVPSHRLTLPGLAAAGLGLAATAAAVKFPKFSRL
jgi:hypothetical protein